jgi:hypothetical protein
MDSHSQRAYGFVFSRPVAYPANIHNMKSYYLTKELLSRGQRVVWFQLGRSDRSRTRDGIEFVNIPIPATNVLLTAFALLRMVAFCLAKRIDVVYMDEWLFFRHRPVWTLAGVAGLRAVGIKVVFDESSARGRPSTEWSKGRPASPRGWQSS